MNNEATEAVAVIDPYNCCYGDSKMLDSQAARLKTLMDSYLE